MAVFRVEKTKDFTVMSNHHLRNVSLSLKAKGLLSLMLSLPDNWDYTTKGLAHICKDGVDSISSAIKELEKQGYLTRRRLRDYHGRLGDIEYVIHEKPVLPDGHDTVLPPKRENPRQVNPRQVKPVLGKPEQEKPAQLNIQESITEKSITDISNTHQSIYPASGRMPDGNVEMDKDRIDRIDTYREIIKENIEFEALVHRYGYERVDELVELMLQTVLSQRPYMDAEKQRESKIQQWFSMWLDKQDTGIEDFFALDAVYIESWGPEYHGSGKIKLWFDEWNTRGTVERWDIRQYFHKGDQTVVEWAFRCAMTDSTVQSFDGLSLIRWNEAGQICFLQEFGCNENRYDPYAQGKTPVFREEQPLWF